MSAGADGLFAAQSLDVEIADPPGGPDNIRKVASGSRDFCLTSVHHYLTAWAADGDLAARFVAIVVQRSPLCAVVLEDSPVTDPAHLAGLRVGGSGDPNHTIEFLATMDRLGLGRPEPSPTPPAGGPAALAAGEVDAIVGFVDALPRTRRLVGRPVRAIPVGLDVYASGLVAADRIPSHTVDRMRAALVASLTRQRDDAARGLAELRRRYPDIVAEEAIEGWKLLEPCVFTAAEPGSMDAGRWEETLDFLTTARGLPAPVPARVYRPQYAGAPAPASTTA